MQPFSSSELLRTACLLSKHITRVSDRDSIVNTFKMAQYGSGGYPGRQTDEYGNPVRQTDEYGNLVHHTAGGTMGDYGTTGTTAGGAYGHGPAGMGHNQQQQQEHHGGVAGMLHRSGSSSSSSSEDDGLGGRRKKKGIKEKIKEKLPGGHKDTDDYDRARATTTPGAAAGSYGYPESHEKKGMMEKIKEKLPGTGTGHY